ncbi:hypothetical protein BsWGS_26823 [Bradybaena similaris]
MAASAVAMPAQSLSQQNLHSGNKAALDSSTLDSKPMQQTAQASTSTSQTDNTRPSAHHASGGLSFQRPAYQFRPRFPPNKGGPQDDPALALMYDGKRMRKAIHRKTVDYNPTVLNYIQNRIWQRDRRDRHQIQPDALYAVDLVPPQAMLEQPMNAVTTRFVRTSTNKYRCPIFCVTWTPEGRRLVTGASSGEFTLWNGLTFNFETILQAHETAIRAMRWSHSDSWMVTADHAGYIKYWQSNMNNVKMYQAHKEPVRGISFCPSDSKFASCSDDGTVRLWDFMRCHEEKILRGHGADVRCVDWHPQKALIASGSKDNQQPVKLWDPRTGNSLATLHAHKHTVMDLKWNQNGNWMMTASRDHLLKLFDIRNLKEELQTFKGHKREATAIGWHPIHEGLFASGSADGALMFWMVGCDHEVGAMEEAHEGMVWSVAWHPLGHILASGSNDHATKFWTRNRPGDEMRDKYNLNTLPQGMMEQEMLEYNLETAVPNLPGIGLEMEAPEVKEEEEVELPAIPGLNWEEDAALLKVEERASHKKVPYARPVPRVFEQAWTGEIDVDQLKKEHQQQQKAQILPQNSLLLAQQFLGAALAGMRQQLAANEAARMMVPRAQLMVGPAAPRMIIAPGQPVVGPNPGQVVLFPGIPAIATQSLGQRLLQQHINNANSQLQQGGPGSSSASAANANNQSNSGSPANNMAPPQQGGQGPQAAPNQNQSANVAPHQGQAPGQARPMTPQGGNRPPGHMVDSQGQMRPPGQIGESKGLLRTPRGQKGDIQGMRPPGQVPDSQGHTRHPGGHMEDHMGPLRPQGQMGDNQRPMRHQGQMGDNQGVMRHGGQMGDNQGPMRHGGQMGDNQGPMRHGGQMGDNQGPMRHGGQMGDNLGPMRHGGQMGDNQGPMRHAGQMGDNQGPMRHPGQQGEPQGHSKLPGLLGAAPHIQGHGQQPMNLKPGPHIQAPNGAEGQFGPGPLLQRHGNREGVMDLDMDERFLGQDQSQGSGQTDIGLDLDFRPRLFNGPAGPANYEDQDFRHLGPGPGQNLGGRHPNMGDLRNQSEQDFQGSAEDHRGPQDHFQGRQMGGRNYDEYNEEGNYDEFGDVDERIAEAHDFESRIGSQDRGERNDDYNSKEEGWADYGRQYGDENWDSGSYSEGRSNEFEDMNEGQGDRGSKRVWEEGPGHRGGRSSWRQGEGHMHARGGFRGRAGGHKRGGWGREARGERGKRGDGRDRGPRGSRGGRGAWNRGDQRDY